MHNSKEIENALAELNLVIIQAGIGYENIVKLTNTLKAHRLNSVTLTTIPDNVYSLELHKNNNYKKD